MEPKKILKNLGLAILSTPVTGVITFLILATVSILAELLNRILDFIEQPMGFKIYFVNGFILAFLYLQFRSNKD